MANIQRSFAKGEIAPALYGRADTVLYATGLRTMKNFTAMNSGGATNRPGNEFVCEVKDSTKTVRLVKFSFNSSQTYCLEFGDYYIRVIREGAQQTDLALTITGITAANPPVVSYSGTDTGFVNGDEVAIDGVIGMTQVNGRNFKAANVNVGANTFELQTMAGANVNGTPYTAYASAGTANRVYTLTSPYAYADLPEIRFAQSGDTIYLAHPSYPPKILTRSAHNAWTIANAPFNPVVARPTAILAGSITAGSNSYKWKVTAIDVTTGEESLPGTDATQAVTGITKANPAVVTYGGADTYANGDEVYITGVGGMTEVNGRNFIVANVDVGANTFELLGVDSTNYTTLTGAGTVARTFYSVTGAAAPTIADPHTLSWTAVSTAKAYNVYRDDNGGGIYGLVGIVNTNSFVDNVGTADLSENPPIYEEVFYVTGEYPSAVNFYQQRAVFGNSDNEPEKIWTSRVGLFSNFTTSTVPQDDDAVSFTLAGQEVNEISHLVDLGRLVCLTSGGETVIHGNDSGTITPTAINARPQTNYGSSSVRPVVIGGRIIMVQGRNSIVRDVIYRVEEDGYRGKDLTIPSNHLFRGEQIVDMAYQQNPDSIVWCVRGDGVLLGLTYIPEQEVFAWHRHITDGEFENVISVPEGNEDKLYFVVKRTVNGVEKRYIERSHNRFFSEVSDAVFMDSSLSVDGNNNSAVTMTLTGGTDWLSTETLTLTASASPFTDADGNSRITFTAADVDNEIHFTTATGDIYRFRIRAYSSATVVTGTMNKTVTVASGLRSTAVTTWGKALKTISGLWHLEGESVSVFGDGFVEASPNNTSYDSVTVASGVATLTKAYVKIHAGLPYLCDLETLDIETINSETIFDKKKSVGKVSVHVDATRGLWAGHDENDTLNEVKARSFETYDEPNDLGSGKQEIILESQWNDHGRVFLRIKDPVPATILAIVESGFIGGR